MRDKITLKAHTFGGFLWSKISGLENSGLYCYFNSLIQSLSNCSNVQRLLQEHSTTIETGNSKFDLFQWNILGKYVS